MKEFKNIIIQVDEALEGKRIDVVMAMMCEGYSRSYLQGLIDSGKVMVDGEPILSKKHIIKGSEKIEVEIPQMQKMEPFPENIALDVYYEDEELIVINKPWGMVVHMGNENETGTLVNGLLYHCRGRLSDLGGSDRPGIVHRIDKDTSGLIVAAKTNFSHEHLSKQLAEHSTNRIYHAIVYNSFSEEEGTIDAPIGRHPRERVKYAVLEGDERDQKVRKAVTHYRVLERLGNFSYLEVKLETGRTHQIRVHMSHINHPLLGDSVYGSGRNKFGANRQMLHAKTLGFIHPRTGEYMEFDSELPKDFQKTLDRLRKG